MAKWNKCTIVNATGKHEAIAPLVISASRATDIPAFHSAWFMERLRKGYCVWQNPFNAAQSMYVSFSQCRVLVFWTKNPLPLLPYLDEITERGYQCYFHYTLNNYVTENFEPHLPALKQRIATFQQLSARLGSKCVIWRYDPIIMGKNLTTATHIARIDALGALLSPYTEKLVFSRLAMYRKTILNLSKVDTSLRPPDRVEIQDIARGIIAANAGWKSSLHLASCAEAVDFTSLGIAKNSCIDAGLILRLCPHDDALKAHYTQQGTRKDTGQRKHCSCAESKDIGCYNTCLHGCVYCYANQSEKHVYTKLAKRIAGSESIL